MTIRNQHFLSATLSIFILLLFIGCKSEIQLKSPSLIPYPNALEWMDGTFNHASVTINHAGQAEVVALFTPKLEQYFELHDTEASAQLTLTVDSSLVNEAYMLQISANRIDLTASSTNGFLYGFTTLTQLLDQYVLGQYATSSVNLPCLRIKDQPQYKWRGMHLDVSRHFYDVDFVKKMLDAMAHHKLNVFHWHLTDDQGWRIEIKKYPTLTQKGGWREETIKNHMANHPKEYDGIRYGGFYTQEQIKEVVAYASKLGIMVVPEIEMPGHAVAAARAFPELTCTGSPQPFNEWGVSDDVFCAGNENTFAFLQGVIDEVVQLFPAPYIHIGGDECPKSKWKTCEKCQKRIKVEGLADELELQSYFVKRMEKYIGSKGKQLIGWDEILEGGLAEGATVMSWRGVAGGVEAATQGHDVIICPNEEVYLDHYQSSYNEPLAIAGLTTLESIYNWSPMPQNLPAKYKHHVLGAQANVWTEYMTTTAQTEYMIFPRLVALAEILWTADSLQNYASFTKRMNLHYSRLDDLNLNYRIPYPEGLLPVDVLTANSDTITLSVPIATATIYYTTDGSNPIANGIAYKNPILLTPDTPSLVHLKCATKMPNGRWSAINTSYIYRGAPLKAKSVTPQKGVIYQLKAGEFSSADFQIARWDSTYIQPGIHVAENAPDGFFAEQLTGYLEVPQSGIYTFSLSANDGSILSINDRVVINNDGFSYGSTRQGRIALEAGLHPFKIRHFEAKYGSYLQLSAIAPNGTALRFDSENTFH